METYKLIIMDLDFISQKEILKQFKRKDLTDAQKARYAIYLMDSAYKFGFEEHQNRLNYLLKDPFLNKKIASPSFKITDK